MWDEPLPAASPVMAATYANSWTPAHNYQVKMARGDQEMCTFKHAFGVVFMHSCLSSTKFVAFFFLKENYDHDRKVVINANKFKNC